ncbi:MAG: hypothetical protein KatS3mg033_2068 [Thermonema sp.]|uniref:OmpA family protein n=1 Tax=Thermonema sp. TaxID=2231181 RepID=UPI0021DB8841|nr:OmpA family protein [Thermonema sp.]GIV40268.1 MAG: hypothetical protein KatS3mg033_2068 [Thermonema sp.]
MKKVFLATLSLCLHLSLAWAQNLVPNPGFEQYDRCPTQYGEIARAVPWLCVRGTPDFLAACTSNRAIKTPGNYFGSMVAHSGGNYAGLASYHPTVPNEMIAVKLLRPLRKGRRYRAGYWLSLAYSYSGYASNNMGLRFTNNPYADTLATEAHLRMENILDYTGGWTLFEGVFRADRDYEYLLIGNFYTKERSKLKERPFAVASSAYYYIDDVFVEELPDSNEVVVNIEMPAAPEAELRVKPEQGEERKGTFRGDTTLYLPKQRYRVEIHTPGNYPVIEDIVPDSTEYTLRPQPQPLQKGETIVLRHIYFDFNKATLKKESYAELDLLVDILRQNPQMRILISGHTDNVGSTGYNQRLSLMRAATVRDYLVSKGVAPQRMEVKGWGMERPIAPNTTEEGRALNRRVEFTILEF